MFVPVLLFSVIAHEYAHGYAALKQGDDTALMLGRLTWNPVKHIDPFMTILLPLVLSFGRRTRRSFGGAKPVPVDPRNYRNFKQGDIIVSLAGVSRRICSSHSLRAAHSASSGSLGRAVPSLHRQLGIFQAMMIRGVQLNAVLDRLQPDSDSAARWLARHEVPAASGVGAPLHAVRPHGLVAVDRRDVSRAAAR